ncbi:MAG: DUF2760 domain-containing protein [Polyangiaceae bacterium]|nr:DUF2760 domain-containing protein [Polyangiaceae bacterium]
MQAALTLGQRIPLAFRHFFRVLFDGQFAASAGAECRSLPPAITVGDVTLTSTPETADSPHPPSSTLGESTLMSPSGQNEPHDKSSERERGALMLLSLLQQDGRLIDFLQQDVEGHSDGDLAAAARVVHAGCRKTLNARTQIAPLLSEPEGSPVTVPAGYGSQSYKLSGNISGPAPYSGTLEHPGWRSSGLQLPIPAPDHDAEILAPAEVLL